MLRKYQNPPQILHYQGWALEFDSRSKYSGPGNNFSMQRLCLQCQLLFMPIFLKRTVEFIGPDPSLDFHHLKRFLVMFSFQNSFRVKFTSSDLILPASIAICQLPWEPNNSPKLWLLYLPEALIRGPILKQYQNHADSHPFTKLL